MVRVVKQKTKQNKKTCQTKPNAKKNKKRPTGLRGFNALKAFEGFEKPFYDSHLFRGHTINTWNYNQMVF